MTAFESRKDKLMSWNGWGYKDSYYYRDENGDIHFAGDKRYFLSGKLLPRARDIYKAAAIDYSFHTPSQSWETVSATIPDPIVNNEFVQFLDANKIQYSYEKKQRFNRAHGQDTIEIFHIRTGTFKRIPDIVVWPNCHDDVVKIVAAAHRTNVVIIPVGGGTNVTAALVCPEDEQRMIVSLDMTVMNRILWINKGNMTARAEAGCAGIELEEELNKRGFTLGHMPDSAEFSTLGGWVSTRASGIKQRRYGNIEDIVVHITAVTPAGILEKNCQVPRMSAGPDLHHFILGSEGTLGVVTEVVFKIHPLPECKQYALIVFPNFRRGFEAVHEITRARCKPAAMRLCDNSHFSTGRSLSPDPGGIRSTVWEMLVQFYITVWNGCDRNEVCVLALLFEGGHDETATQRKTIFEISSKYGGFNGGGFHSEFTYKLMFMTVYLRDLIFDYGLIATVLETSVSWDRTMELIEKLLQTVNDEGARHGMPVEIFYRIPQMYDDGVCVYMYYTYNYKNLASGDPIALVNEVDDKLRSVIIECGGSLSHHHGVGKLRRNFLPKAIGETGVSAFRALKDSLDPKNIFANGNLVAPISKL